MAVRRCKLSKAEAALFALLMGALVSAQGDAQAGTCTCPVPSSNVSQSAQSGPSVCMAAQDETGCALQTISVPQPGAPLPKQSDDRETLERLGRQSQVGAPDGQSRMSLNQAFRVAPVGWTNKEFDAVIGAVLGIAQRRLGPDGVAGLEAALTAHADEMRQVFTDISYERRVEYLGIGSYDAMVSYGCLEVARSNFIAIIRAPFTAAGRRCNAF